MKEYIYKFTNKINNKIYIGLTRLKIKYGYNQHINSKDNYPIHLALRKYGINNIDFTIEEEVEMEDIKCLIRLLNNLEINYIKEYNSLVPNGYNIQKGGGINYIKNKKKNKNRNKENTKVFTTKVNSDSFCMIFVDYLSPIFQLKSDATKTLLVLLC